jgi:hypothetical protein
MTKFESQIVFISRSNGLKKILKVSAKRMPPSRDIGFSNNAHISYEGQENRVFLGIRYFVKRAVVWLKPLGFS